jgi:HK97 gp10 family phage protein
MLAVAFNFKNDREIAAALEAIPAELRAKALPIALRAAGRLVTRRARRLAPVDTGLLKKSLGLVLRRPKGQPPYVALGARRGFKATVTREGKKQVADPANYAHLVELGHAVVPPVEGTSLRKKTAEAIGFVPPQPFLRPALEGQAPQIRALFIRELANAQTILAARLARKASKAAFSAR